MNPVLCVRNDRDDTLGIAVPMLTERGVPVIRLDAFDAEPRWPGLDEISGLVVFGGEMNADEIERYPYLLTQRELMQRAVDAGMPVLGICLGAQMLARALDARVYRAPLRELGFKPVRMTPAGEADTLLGAFHTGDRVFQWHEDTFDWFYRRRLSLRDLLGGVVALHRLPGERALRRMAGESRHLELGQ